MPGSRVPRVSPGWISGGNRSLGRPRGPNSSVAHSPATASNSPVVEALVASVRRCPVSRNAIRSGISRACSPSRVRFGGELVERVELQELQPRGGVEPCRVQFPVHPGDGGAAAFVPVAVRLRGELAGGVDEAVVHRPGVDADAGDRFAPLRCRLAGGSEAGEHLGEEGVEVPAEAAVGLHHAVGETVHDVERGPRRTAVGGVGSGSPDPVLIRPRMTRPEEAPMSTAANTLPANRPPSTLSCCTGCRCGAHRRKAAATPASTGMWRPVVWDSSALVSTAAALATFSGRTSRLSRVRWA